MHNKLNLHNKLDFSEIDLTAPDKVVEETLTEIPKETQGMVCGEVVLYNGHVNSYTESKKSLAEALGTITTERYVDIQDCLGKCGEESKKFECFLYTPVYPKYKYRMFFMKYGIANYPVKFTLEESIAKSIQGYDSNYIITCDRRSDVEELVIKILTSSKIIGVMQELIRIYQAKKNEFPGGEGVVRRPRNTDQLAGL